MAADLRQHSWSDFIEFSRSRVATSSSATRLVTSPHSGIILRVTGRAFSSTHRQDWSPLGCNDTGRCADSYMRRLIQ